MKHQAPNSLKFQRLQRRLKETKRATVGILELLWHATQVNAPQGDIGRFTDEEISVLCDWDGEPGQLIEALIETGWVDKHDEHRLTIHDWHEHAPTYLKGNMASRKQDFVCAKGNGKHTALEPAKQPAKNGAKQPAKNGAKQDAKQAAKQGTPNQPNQTNQTNPPLTPPCEADEPGTDRNPEDFKTGGEELLIAVGVREARTVVHMLERHGCTLVELRALIQHWSQNVPAWGPGALVDRLMAYRPGQDPTDLWPEPSAEVVRQRSRAETSRKAAELHELHERQRAERAADDERMAELDAKYGAYIDSMTDKQIRAFATNALGESASFLLRRYTGGPPVGSLREMLLLDLEKSQFVPP